MIYEELYSFDAEQRALLGCICGVDEAGRGPLAGPVCCAAVLFGGDERFEWLNDSKKVSEKRREVLFEQIKENCVAYHIELIDNNTIDELNILGATMLGMKRCAEALMPYGAAAALIDGNRCPEAALHCVPVIKGDAHSASIAAASVLAKVTRDRYMVQLDSEYPQYGFAVHKGYPTKAHYAALEAYGITPYHRRSFLKGRGLV